MNRRDQLKQIESLLAKTRNLVATLAAEENDAKPVRGRPDPDTSQRVARAMARPDIWKQLAAKEGFTVHDVKNLLKKDPYCSRRSDSSFSSILSKWARDGHLKVKRPGSGPRPTIYQVRRK